MKDGIDLIVQYSPLLLDSIIHGILISMFSLGIVYIFGRMLGILRTYTSKNIIALISMIGFSYWSIVIYEDGLLGSVYELVLKMSLYVAVASIFYVLVGFDLYDRFNTWSDSKFGHPKRHTGNERKKGTKL